METRWYLSSGQALEDVDIKDRTLALHATGTAWKKITAHLDRKRLMQEAIERERKRKKDMMEASKAMTDSWDNSFENIRRRKEAERVERLVKSKEDKMSKFFVMREEQDAIRQKLVEEIREEVYASKGYPKDVTSAFIASEVYHQRQKQVEFREVFRRKAEEDEAAEAAKIREGVEAEKREALEKRRRTFEKNVDYSKIYVEEMKRRAEELRIEKDKRVAAEIEDQKHAEIEMREMLRRKAEEAAEYKVKIKEDIEKQVRRRREEIELDVQNEKERDKLIDICAASKQKIERLRKKKEREMQESKNERCVQMGKVLTHSGAKVEELEHKLYEQQVAEKEAVAERKLVKKAEKLEKGVRERHCDYKQALERRRREKEAEEVMVKWEMAERYKKVEETRAYDLAKQKKNWEAILDYRRQLFEQMDVKRKKEYEENAERRLQTEADRKKLEDEDKKFLNFANQVLEEAKAKGRSTLPIEHVIETYKKNNLLKWPKPEREYCQNIEGPERKKLLNDRPGRKCHDPKSDPNYGGKTCNDYLYQ